MTLLLDRRGLGVTLGNDDTAQIGAVFAGHVLPRLFAFVVAEVDVAIRFAVVQKNTPAVVAHLHMAKLRPALRVHADGGAQIHLVVGRAFGAHVVPPIDEVGLPLLEGALQSAVTAEVHVVGNFFAVVDG